MNICFIAADNPRERMIGDAFVKGVRRHRDHAFVEMKRVDPPTLNCDAVVMFGVKSLKLWKAYGETGIRRIYLDKGYTRRREKFGGRMFEWWRVSIDAQQPTSYLMNIARPDNRLRRNKMEMAPWRDGEHIVFAGSSEKYHAFHGLPHPTEYAQRVVATLRQYTARPILYRPKPSWRGAEPIEGTTYSPPGQSIGEALAGAHALVTHGSSACIEAVCAGVPCIIPSEVAVAHPISDFYFDRIEAPYRAPDKDRLQWLANISYCQWTVREFASGEAWEVIKEQMG